MSAELQAVADALQEREHASAAFTAALRAAYEAGHSLREIAHYAGMTHAGVAHYLRREENAR